MPPMGVEVATLAAGDVEQASEFIGTVKSRRSVTVQPQVEGFVTRIRVASGDRVRTGAVLMEIDAGRQEAAVATLQAQRGAREADLAYWRQQSARLKTLLEAGAVSQQEFDQADSTVKSGEAQLAALDQQIREQNVELGGVVDGDACCAAQARVRGEVGIVETGLPNVVFGGSLLFADLAEHRVVEQHVPHRNVVLDRGCHLGEVLAEATVAGHSDDGARWRGGPCTERCRVPEADRAEIAGHQHVLAAGFEVAPE